MELNSDDVQGETISTPHEQLEERDLEIVKLAASILAGAVLEGSDELVRQMRYKEIKPIRPDIFHGAKIPGETSMDVLRFALMGFLVDSSIGVSKAASTVGRASDKAAGWLISALKPFTHSRIMLPARRRFYRLYTIGEERLESWIETGRIRDKESRLMARQAAEIIINDFLEYMSTNKGIQELVQEQGISMTSEAIAEIRARSANADEFAENIFNTILRRRNQIAKQPDQPDQAGLDSFGKGDVG